MIACRGIRPSPPRGRAAPLATRLAALATVAALGGAARARADRSPEAPAAAPSGAPVADVPELLRQARTRRPPRERGPFRPPALVDLHALEPTLRLDIRYASAANFLGAPVYPSARALLQRPVAEALARAHGRLAAEGLGLVVHDAYRPWFVTWVFWRATPPSRRRFVADPRRGSRHNRGCAVDVELYALATGATVEMPSAFDEMTERARADWDGGSAAARRHRDLLRAALSAEGFRVAPHEWWHFDHASCGRYGILNVGFDELGLR